MQSISTAVREQMILSSADLFFVNQKAQGYYDQNIGWEPLGPIIPVSVKDAERGSHILYIQTLIRKVVA